MFGWKGKWKGPGTGQHQYSDDKSLGVAGDDNGNYGLFISDDFDNGVSKPSNMYGNDQLSKHKMFECCKVEVWSIYE